MAAVWYRFRAELRARWRAWLGLALLVGLASGAALTFAGGARRTDTAYRRFLDAHDAYDVLVVNYPEDGTAVFDFDALARLPAVADSARAHFEYYTFEAGNLVSDDGRIGSDINRFEILEGRRANPERPDEVVVGFVLAEEHGLEVGDEVDFLPRDLIELLESGATEDPEGELTSEDIASARRLLKALPDGMLRIVGIEASPGEFPPQFQVNRPLVHLSPALLPFVEDVSEGHEALMVRLHGGPDGVDDFLTELDRRSGGLVPSVIVQRDHAAAVERSIHLQAVALWLLAGLTALTALLILGQLFSRLTYVEARDAATLRALGMTARERTALNVLRVATIAAAGTAVGVVGAVLASPTFPAGLARRAEPAPGFHADLVVLFVGAALWIVVITAMTVWPAVRATRLGGRGTETAAVTRRSRVGRAIAPGAAIPPVAVGMRMALEPGRGAAAVPVRSAVAGVALGIAALVAAVTFGASLAHLLDTPRLYGQTWDLQLVTFEGEELGLDAAEVLRDDDRVVGVARAIAAVDFQSEIDGESVGLLALDFVDGALTPPIFDGRAPAARDEIALGKNTLDTLDASIGDTVEVRAAGLTEQGVPMRVVGTTVFPALGERAQLGRGALITLDGVARLDPADPEGGGELLVRLAPGADGDAVMADFAEQLDEDIFGFPGGEPTDIVNFGRVEAMPFVLGAVLAAISAATLAHLLLSAVRRRRRDLAILKTLGFVRSQVAGVVSCQANAVVLLGLLVGIPVGVALGRWVWGLMADNLGVVSEPQVPVVALAVIVPGAVLLANAIAFVPGRLAAGTHPATDLRPE